MNYNICIDFGTCNTVISYIEDNILKQIQDNLSDDVLIPSNLYFLSSNLYNNSIISELEPDKDYIIGNIAIEQVNLNKDWEYYFFQFKRFLGITSKSINLYKDFLIRYNLDYTSDEDTLYFFLKLFNSDKIKLKFSICDLIKLYFKALKKMIINKIHNLSNLDKIQIIITCPAYFHDLQRTQLKRAAEQAGFDVYKLINEPTAAAVYYINRLQTKLNNNSNNNFNTNIQTKYIIYDLGGGTIDTTVIDYYQSTNTCDVIDIEGNNALGGIDIDNILTFDIIQRYSIDKTNIKWLNKIKRYAEEIKIKLTTQLNYSIFLENVPVLKFGKLIFIDNLKITYSRHLFNNLINDIIEEMIQSIKNMYIKYNTSNIIFIGGPTQIPILQSKICSILNINPNKINTIGTIEIINDINDNINNYDHNNDHINNNDNFNNIINFNIKTYDLSILYKTIVSQGGSILYKKILTKDDFCLLDIIPMNIGITDNDNNIIIMIEKNSKIPISIERIFTTSHDCQRTIDIEIYEGLNNKCLYNTFIGSYKIIGIPPLPKGMVLIKLLFKISYNGILEISIIGLKNPSDNSAKSFDYKFNENIKLIPNMITKEILKKLLLFNEKNKKN
jgi:molecular chaperone DnaK (HSP70)